MVNRFVCCILSSAALVVASAAFAQSPAQEVLLGVQGGLTYSRLFGSENFGFRYTYPFGNYVSELHFNTLGGGWSGLGGLRMQIPLSHRFGLILGLQDIELTTGSAQTIVRNPAPEISGPGPVTVLQNYQDRWSYTNIDVLLRYMLTPSWLYAFAGASAAILTSDGFDATQEILSGENFVQLPSGTPTNSSFIQLKNYFSVQYYELMRGAVSFGVGSMLPVPIGSLVLTPEIALNIPYTRLFNWQSRQIYTSQGIVSPNLFYGSVSLTLSTPLSTNDPSSPAPETDHSTVTSRLEAPAPPATPKEVTVSGTVRDETSGMPITAHLTVTNLAADARVASISSDSLGHFTFQLVLPGRYSITAESPDHLFRTVPLDLSRDTDAVSLPPFELANLQGRTQLLIFFGYDNATLSSESYPELLRLVSLLSEAPAMKIEIEGYTSSEGSDEYNQTLSEERANAVRSFLILHGINASRIVAIGYGKSRPVATNETEAGRTQNRRVEMRVLSGR
jgi:outer membrane protein OmpA-like peptidoglycan-associated protein